MNDRKRLLRGRSVRLRFTVLYAAVFLGSGTALLALTILLTGGSVSDTDPANLPPGREPGPATVQERIHDLEDRLSALQAEQTRALLAGALVALVVMTGVSVPLGSVVARRVLRPLRTITAATRRISAENLHERLAVRGPADEVKNLADTIDGLLERLEASFAAQRGFVANASHELRTPLATMRASVDVALAKPEPASPQTIALAERLRTQLDQVDGLLEGLLLLARAQHGEFSGGIPVDLGDLVARALAARTVGIEARNLTVEDAAGRGPAWVHGSPALLARMVDNVIDNAVVHNAEGGRIRVAVTTAGGTVRLTVRTDGPVLDPAQVARLGRPFQRLEDRTGTGSGLGLSIVAAIVAAHGGVLELRAADEGGLHAGIGLPAAEGPAA